MVIPTLCASIVAVTAIHFVTFHCIAMFRYFHEPGAVPDGHVDFVSATQYFNVRIKQPATLVLNIISILCQCEACFDKNEICTSRSEIYQILTEFYILLHVAPSVVVPDIMEFV